MSSVWQCSSPSLLPHSHLICRLITSMFVRHPSTNMKPSKHCPKKALLFFPRKDSHLQKSQKYRIISKPILSTSCPFKVFQQMYLQSMVTHQNKSQPLKISMVLKLRCLLPQRLLTFILLSPILNIRLVTEPQADLRMAGSGQVSHPLNCVIWLLLHGIVGTSPAKTLLLVTST